MCSGLCYPGACIGSCGGCGPSGFYDPYCALRIGPCPCVGPCGPWGNCW